MANTRTIRYIPYKDIDLDKWDQCITDAPNGSVYFYSTYLDHMSRHWDALILDDYRAVMPLTWNRKWGVHYLYQPPLSAEGGIIGSEPVTGSLIKLFLEAIPNKFRLWEINLNRSNLLDVPGFPLYVRMNYRLPLQGAYTHLKAGYRDNIKRNINKAHQAGLRYTNDLALEEVISLAARHTEGGQALEREHLSAFHDLYKNLAEKKMAVVRGIVDDKGTCLASAAFLFSHDTAYYLLVGNHPYGKTKGASHLLIDQFVEEYAGSPLTLDFEGSDLPGLAFFYSGFGAVEDPYAAIRLNRLPGTIRWLKR